MAINKKLITFAKESVFLGANGINHATTASNGMYGQIPAHSIVFIKDKGYIWQDGKYYGRINDQIIADDTSTDDGFVYKKNGIYYRAPFTLWGNDFNGKDPSVDGDLIVKQKWSYGTAGIRYVGGQNPIPVLTVNESTFAVTVPSGPFALNGGDFTISYNGTKKFEIKQATGNLDALSGYLKGNHLRNTPMYIDGTKTRGTTWTGIKQYDASGTATSLATTLPAYLTIQEGPHTSGSNWKPWITDADSTSHASWGIGLSGDNFYIGRVTNTQTTNALSNSWKFDSSGYITSKGYKVPNGTSAGFLKADGSVDTTSYIKDGWIVSYSPTEVNFSGGTWVDSGLDLSSYSAMINGAYLLCIDDGTIKYTGIFSYMTGTITTDEEILLHACGTKHTYNSGPAGILYAKIKPRSNNKAGLFLAYNQSITNKDLDIKIKKLASI